MSVHSILEADICGLHFLETRPGLQSDFFAHMDVEIALPDQVFQEVHVLCQRTLHILLDGQVPVAECPGLILHPDMLSIVSGTQVEKLEPDRPGHVSEHDAIGTPLETVHMARHVQIIGCLVLNNLVAQERIRNTDQRHGMAIDLAGPLQFDLMTIWLLQPDGDALGIKEPPVIFIDPWLRWETTSPLLSFSNILWKAMPASIFSLGGSSRSSRLRKADRVISSDVV